MKLERLISMIYMLLNHEVISASVLADKYGVSQRTIYRDIDAICAAGIPVVSYQGAAGGYGIMESYKLDKSLLGSYDIETLITMLNGLSAVFPDEAADETVRKLKTLTREGDTPSLTLHLDSRQAPADSLRKLRSAIKQRRVAEFDYVNIKNERLRRAVEPVCLIYKNHTWYLHAYCRSRRDYREFRLTRMHELEVLPEVFSANHSMPVLGRPDYAHETTVDPTIVVLHFCPHILARALDYFQQEEKTFHEDGSLTVRLTLKTPSDSRWLFPLLLSFGDSVELVEPADLRSRFAATIEGMLRRYGQ